MLVNDGTRPVRIYSRRELPAQNARIQCVRFSLNYRRIALIMLEKFIEIPFLSSSENSSFTVKNNVKISGKITDSPGLGRAQVFG